MVGIRRGIAQGPRGQGGIAGAAGLREDMHRAGVLEGPQLAAQVQALGEVRGATVVHPAAWHVPPRPDQQPVLVVLDKAQFDRKLDLPPESNLHLHRRELQGVIMYEISPLTEARVISAMREMKP